MQQQDFQRIEFSSRFLNRIVILDIYGQFLGSSTNHANLLLINDGQDLVSMQFPAILKYYTPSFPILIVGVHAGADRKQEYGVAGYPDFMGRGAKASLYATFIIEELFPHLREILPTTVFRKKYLAGFSLGGLMAFDMLMEYPQEFTAVGVFSGSFWWRSKGLDDGYVEDVDRIMHAKIRTKQKHNGIRFFLQTGQLDEKADRNNNGIIDSIDDTLGIIEELSKIGYIPNQDIRYLELADGKHDIATWGRVMPQFLDWLNELK
jgi:enterochelin esterase-like enzyme